MKETVTIKYEIVKAMLEVFESTQKMNELLKNELEGKVYISANCIDTMEQYPGAGRKITFIIEK